MVQEMVKLLVCPRPSPTVSPPHGLRVWINGHLLQKLSLTTFSSIFTMPLHSPSSCHVPLLVPLAIIGKHDLHVFKCNYYSLLPKLWTIQGQGIYLFYVLVNTQHISIDPHCLDVLKCEPKYSPL